MSERAEKEKTPWDIPGASEGAAAQILMYRISPRSLTN
jgi:hypothetical protein